MDLNNLKKTGVNSLEVSDSLHAPLIKFNVEVGETTSIPDENNMIIYVAKDIEDEEKSQIIFPMNSPLNRMNEISDEFVIMPVFLGNKVKMGAYVTRKIGRELEEKSITLNKDLSGSTLKLNLVTFQRFSTFTLFASNNYKILDHIDTLEDGNYETIALRKSDNTLVKLAQVDDERDFYTTYEAIYYMTDTDKLSLVDAFNPGYVSVDDILKYLEFVNAVNDGCSFYYRYV